MPLNVSVSLFFDHVAVDTAILSCTDLFKCRPQSLRSNTFPPQPFGALRPLQTNLSISNFSSRHLENPRVSANQQLGLKLSSLFPFTNHSHDQIWLLEQYPGPCSMITVFAKRTVSACDNCLPTILVTKYQSVTTSALHFLHLIIRKRTVDLVSVAIPATAVLRL